MSAPNYVPQPALNDVRRYKSPPRRAGSWVADRPGDNPSPRGGGLGLGIPGPDQGYVLKLIQRFRTRVHLGESEHFDDVSAGVSAIALKRAALFGRAPIGADLEVAFTIFGFFDDQPEPALAQRRSRWFAALHMPHHYPRLRWLVDQVPDDVLRLSKAAALSAAVGAWAAIPES